QAEPHDFSDQAIAILYTMLAYHRLNRHHTTDDLTQKLLDRAQQLKPDLETQQSLRSIRYYSIKLEKLNNVDMNGWTVRETDFDSAKIKKIEEWLGVLDQYDRELESIEENSLLNDTPLAKADQEIDDEFSNFRELLNNSVD